MNKNLPARKLCLESFLEIVYSKVTLHIISKSNLNMIKSPLVTESNNMKTLAMLKQQVSCFKAFKGQIS